MSDSFPKSIELKKRSLHERIIVAKVLLESVLDDLPSVQPERKKGKWTYRDGKPATIGESYSVICSECNEWSEYCTNFCHNCGADMRPQFEEPEINPCRGCEDYDGKGGCKTKGGCAGSRGDSE